jgi:cytochrome c oxidase subunit 2
MKRTRVGLLVLLGVVALALVVDPAAAQSTADSTTEELIWDLNGKLLAAAVPIAILTEGILIYTVWKFRKNESPLPTQENRRLEITWTIATAVVLLFVGVASYQVLADPYVAASAQEQIESQQEPLEVEVVAQRYSWTFNYEDQGVSSSNTLVIPADRPVALNITSSDWLHAFHVPGLGLKQDAIPGQHNLILTKAHGTGSYQLYCAEYCGSGHSRMLGTVEVRSESSFQDWIESQ